MFCVKYILKNPKYVFYSQSSVVSETFTRGTFLGIEKNKIKNKTKRGCHTKKKEKHTEKRKKIYIKKTFLPFNSPYILLLHESIWTYILLVHSNIAMTKTSRGKSFHLKWFLSRPLGKNESLAAYLSTNKTALQFARFQEILCLSQNKNKLNGKDIWFYVNETSILVCSLYAHEKEKHLKKTSDFKLKVKDCRRVIWVCLTILWDWHLKN